MKLQHQTGAAMAPNILELQDKSSGSLSKTMRETTGSEKLESLPVSNKSSTLNIEQEEELRLRRLGASIIRIFI